MTTRRDIARMIDHTLLSPDASREDVQACLDEARELSTYADLFDAAGPLRIALRCDGPDRLSLRLLKRRGPPLDRPLRLALAPVLGGGARRRSAPRWCGGSSTRRVRGRSCRNGRRC